MVPFNGLLGNAQLLLYYLGLDTQIRQLVPQTLVLDSQIFAFLLADLDLLIQHDRPLYSHVVLGLQVLERRRLVTALTLKVVVLNFSVPQLQL